MPEFRRTRSARGFLRASVAAGIAALAPLPAQAAVVAPGVEELAASPASPARIPVIVWLRERVDLEALRIGSARPGERRAALRSRLVRELRNAADRAGGPLRDLLARHGVPDVEPLWLINALALALPTPLLEQVSRRPEVERITLDATISLPAPGAAVATTAGWNLSLVGAPDLWEAGFTGQGVVVATMDTGADPAHPDLAASFRGGSNSWFDPYGTHASPSDLDGHGTQSLGLIVGGSASGTPIGMAPGAQWIAAKIFDDAGQASLSGIHLGFQWLLDPDGDPDVDDAPDIVNGSWDLGAVGVCDDEFQSDVYVLEAAEILVVLSGGNYGPAASTSVSPANGTGSLAVGAVDQFTNVAGFSSRGPSACDGGVYPDLAAPGANVVTTDLTFGGIFPDSYVTVSGTSFAAPHVSGALALLKSAKPAASANELEDALRSSAVDLAALGLDNDSGWGLIDVTAAHQILMATPVPSLSAWGRGLSAALMILLVFARHPGSFRAGLRDR